MIGEYLKDGKNHSSPLDITAAIMKAFSLLGLLVVLSVVALHSAGAEEAQHEEYESDSALREIDMRELEEALRELFGSQYGIRKPLNGNWDEQLLRRRDFWDFIRNVGKKIKDAIQKLSKPAVLAE